MNPDLQRFISRLSTQLGRPGGPEAPPNPPPSCPDSVAGKGLSLLGQFIDNARLNNTMVETCTRRTFTESVCKMASTLGQGPITAARDPFFSETGLYDQLKDDFTEVTIWDQTAPSAREIGQAERSAVGISTCVMALAESGTVMVFSWKGSGRSITLLPTTTLFVIHAEDIQPRLTQAMTYLDTLQRSELPASINLISGASSTADIELVRVQGVHGPVEIGYLIVCPEAGTT